MEVKAFIAHCQIPCLCLRHSMVNITGRPKTLRFSGVSPMSGHPYFSSAKRSTSGDSSSRVDQVSVNRSYLLVDISRLAATIRAQCLWFKGRYRVFAMLLARVNIHSLFPIKHLKTGNSCRASLALSNIELRTLYRTISSWLLHIPRTKASAHFSFPAFAGLKIAFQDIRADETLGIVRALENDCVLRETILAAIHALLTRGVALASRSKHRKRGKADTVLLCD